ncbi:hypothetical protein LWI29_035110 [Acer saccharum]|uniref:peroxidase n=1 Tax=Acer saccharum TaxID=4024 RepID=A0AA39TZV9_ACESA|nr:hypothetical protein LWI29_035110 [Acer saccharum]
MMRARNIVFVFLVSLLVLGVFRVCSAYGDGDGNVAGLRLNFYAKSCPTAEIIVKGIILSRVPTNPTLPAKLLRMHFHDCFVRGCDASVLLNAVNNVPAEKDSIPNASLSGFDVIDDIKTVIENRCPGVVSCADILALAARDAVSFPCPNPANSATTVELDPRSSKSFDKNYFNILLQNKGLLQSDAALLKDGNSLQLVERFSNSSDFFNAFAKSMVKMGAIEVLTGYAGEIRKRCSVVNPKN